MSFFRSIKFRLFSVYSIIIITILVSFFAFFYIYSKNTIEDNEYKALNTQSETIANSIDAHIQNADLLTQRVLFSSRLKDIFYDRIFLEGIDYNQVREFYTLINTLAGPQTSMRQVNIFDINGRFISVGTNSTVMKLGQAEISSIEWVRRCTELDGRRFVLTPHGDFWSLHKFEVISITRSFPRFFGGKPENIIEAQMDADYVFASAIEAGSDVYVNIIDGQGNSIFPLEASEEDTLLAGIYLDEYLSAKNENRSLYGTLTVNNPFTGGVDCFSVVPLSKANWFVAVSKPLDVVLEPVTRLRDSTVFLGVAVLAATLFITYLVAKRITTPLTKIHNSIEELNLKMLPAESQIDVEKGLDELERLQIAYNNMTKKLSETLDEVVMARSMQVQSKLLALQAQMNPHFLFNTLSIINILAEEHGDSQIMGISDRLISMFHEILYEKREYVTIEQELKNTMDYLELLKIRFNELLQYEIDIPENLRSIYVPHLILQPLVENCAKYAVSEAAPWIIKLEGSINGDEWRLKVTDNGAGFSQEATDYLVNFMKDSREYMGLDKMGLMNIYSRLKLGYGKQAFFQFGNIAPRGAFVEIGGSVDSEAYINLQNEGNVIDHAAL